MGGGEGLIRGGGGVPLGGGGGSMGGSNICGICASSGTIYGESGGEYMEEALAT